jgi:hypothetical protein
MSRRIFFDGLNLSLERGTGIATYTRLLTRVTRELGNEVGIVCSSPRRPATNWLTRKISSDAADGAPISLPKKMWDIYWDQLWAPLGLRPIAVNGTGTAPDNSVMGHFQATGVRPRFLTDLAAMGIKIPGGHFDPSKPL